MNLGNSKIKNSDYENDWAHDKDYNYVHIDTAKSGKQGYFCIGCQKEMVAVKRKNPNHQSYFRHHIKDVEKENVECVIASKKYRERLAEMILGRLKYVKAPSVYKYPPKGMDGSPMLLKSPETIKANYTKAQQWFYEDENGEVKWGKHPEVKDKYLLIRPDVTLFNSKDQPILFVEFVVTHKLDEEKIVKLSRIGIDTLQIIIPKSPEDKIEQALKSPLKYKWVYNELEANTSYISVPNQNSQGIQTIDEDQRRLFEESFRCRTAKINNLIRAINKCVGSESYRNVERLFESELSRVEENRKFAQERLDGMEESIGAELLKSVRAEEKGLEQRYNSKKDELDRDLEVARGRLEEMEGAYRQRIMEEGKKVEKHYKQLEKSINRDIRAAGKRLGDLERSNRKEALETYRGEEEIVDEGRRRTEELYRELEGRYFRKESYYRRLYDESQRELSGAKEDKITRDLEWEINGAESAIRKIRQSIENPGGREIDRINRDIKAARERVANIRGAIRLQEQENERIGGEEGNIVESVKNELRTGVNGVAAELSRRIKILLEARRVASDFEARKRENERYRKAQEIFKSGAWKTW